MPSLLIADREIVSSPLSGLLNSSSTSGATSPRVWLPIVLATCLVCLIMAAFLFAIAYFRSRQFNEAKKIDPYLSRREFLRRRRLSPSDLRNEEELQRNIMIRKSLATRSSRTISQIELEGSDLDENDCSLREDWKEWEARMRKDKLLDEHPSSVPAAQSMTSLPLPSQTKSVSPGRNPMIQRQPKPPLPELPQL